MEVYTHIRIHIHNITIDTHMYVHIYFLHIYVNDLLYIFLCKEGTFMYCTLSTQVFEFGIVDTFS